MFQKCIWIDKKNDMVRNFFVLFTGKGLVKMAI